MKRKSFCTNRSFGLCRNRKKKLDFSTAQEKAVSYVGMYPEDEEAAKELDFLKSRTGSNE